jgi:hypothetical protein
LKPNTGKGIGMKTPIRIISIATSAFWVFLIIFSASALYSMKDIRVSLGDPHTSITDDNELLFSFPVYVVNTGYYNLAQLNVSTEIFNQSRVAIAQGSTVMPLIRAGETTNATHNMKVNLTDLSENNQHLLFDDSELMLNVMVNMKAAEVIPVQASYNSSIQWGAPLYDLRIGSAQYATFNATHALVSIPISFENHAFFDLTGTVQVSVYSMANTRLTKVQSSIQTPQHSQYAENMKLCVPLTASNGTRVEVSFVTPLFSLGPLVISNAG